MILVKSINFKGGGEVIAVLERLKQSAPICTMRQIAPVYPSGDKCYRAFDVVEAKKKRGRANTHSCDMFRLEPKVCTLGAYCFL
jgi:hypothetical protein